jgi:hypothetical protein
VHSRPVPLQKDEEEKTKTERTKRKGEENDERLLYIENDEKKWKDARRACWNKGRREEKGGYNRGKGGNSDERRGGKGIEDPGTMVRRGSVDGREEVRRRMSKRWEVERKETAAGVRREKGEEGGERAEVDYDAQQITHRQHPAPFASLSSCSCRTRREGSVFPAFSP